MTSPTHTARPPLPPFDAASAITKVRAAEDAWNGRDPARVALAYTPDTRWRNRSEFLVGREAVERFLARKWEREREYRLVKELWAFTGAGISVRFAYEWVDAEGRWTRSYGNEQWESHESGLMRRREASINDVPIDEGARLFRWPLGPRPLAHLLPSSEIDDARRRLRDGHPRRALVLRRSATAITA